MFLFLVCRGGPQQQAQPPPPTQSWYPPSVVGNASSGPSRLPPPPSFVGSSLGTNPHSRPPNTSTNDAQPPPQSSGVHSQTSLPGGSNTLASLKDRRSIFYSFYCRQFFSDHGLLYGHSWNKHIDLQVLTFFAHE